MRTPLRRWSCAALGLLVSSCALLGSSSALLGLSSAPAYAQGAGSTTTLSGVVTDKDGGVVPGATVTVKNDATSVVAATVVTNSVGLYTVPSIEPGVYTVTITLSGFKTVIHSGVRLIAAQTLSLKTVLEVGTLQETVNVVANSELVRSNTATVSSTVTAEFITSLPRTDRNALNFLVFLPGVETIGNSARGSTISGLPQNTINITIDGVSNSNNLQSGDGFFSMVVPRLDAIEEVTMTSAVSGADSSGQGAVQVRFVTRSGTNQYQTSVYEFFRHKSLNTNTFFNRLAGLPKPRITVHNYGGRIGGPIVIPGLIDGRGKAFFFFNQEETFQPNETRRTRTVINEAARQGVFTYNTNNPTSVNVLALAAANGQLATQDPTVQALLAQIRSAVSTTGTLTATGTQFNTESYNYLQLVESARHSPTMRIDINATSKHRISGSYYWQGFNDTPDTLNGADPNFPGFPAFASQSSFRTTGSMALRSTFSSNVVNEVRGGWQWSPVDFFGDANPGMFSNQAGYALSFPFGITNAHPGSANGPQWRNTVNWNVDNNLNWLKGSHNFSMGFSFTRLTNVIDNSTTVQGVNLGFNTTNDPAASLFTTANFPNASTGNLGDARALYALLTGRVSSLPGTGRLNTEGTEFIYNGHIIRRERMDEYGLFIQDSWRFKPNITVNYGVRYELQMPFVPTSGTYTMSGLEDFCGPSGLGNGPGGRLCNMFNPGVLLNPGQVPTYVKYDPGNAGYHTDYNNFGPTVGVSWRPNKQDGFWRTVLGDPDLSTVSAGFTRTFNRERFDRFTGIFGGNPGATTPATRGTGATNFPLVYPGESWPILFRETNRLGPPDFQEIPQYPITASFASGHDINIFHPDIVVPHTNAWSVGFQRSLDRNTAIEFRYIGNRNVNAWTTENWNDVNVYENGFLDEFKLAQRNLQANVRAGRGGTFAYMGPDSGTSPLPIFLAHFSATPMSQAGDHTRYTSTQFTNSTWVDDLDFVFPGPHGLADELWTGNSGTWRTNAAAAGLASNFWVMNPLVDSANVMLGAAGSRYHSFQVDLRRRLSRGLVVNGSYTFAKRWGSSLQELHFDRYYIRSEGIPHAFKFLWNYEIPVGRGKRFGSDMNGWLNAVIGNWEFSGTGRAQLQSYSLENTILVGMSFEEAQREFKKTLIEIDPVTGATTLWDMPQDIRTNTRRAYNTDPTSATGYPSGEEPTGRYFAPAGGPACMALYQGDCAPDMFFLGPWYAEFDFKFLKRFPFGRKASVDFSAEIYNAFYDQNFSPNLNPGSGANIFRITGQQSGARVGQLVWRVNF